MADVRWQGGLCNVTYTWLPPCCVPLYCRICQGCPSAQEFVCRCPYATSRGVKNHLAAQVQCGADCVGRRRGRLVAVIVRFPNPGGAESALPTPTRLSADFPACLLFFFPDSALWRLPACLACSSARRRYYCRPGLLHLLPPGWHHLSAPLTLACSDMSEACRAMPPAGASLHLSVSPACLHVRAFVAPTVGAFATLTASCQQASRSFIAIRIRTWQAAAPDVTATSWHRIQRSSDRKLPLLLLLMLLLARYPHWRPQGSTSFGQLARPANWLLYLSSVLARALSLLLDAEGCTQLAPPQLARAAGMTVLPAASCRPSLPLRALVPALRAIGVRLLNRCRLVVSHCCCTLHMICVQTRPVAGMLAEA